MGEPSGNMRTKPPEFIQRGYAFLMGCVQPDGGVYRTNLASYNTSLSIMAFLAARDPKYDSVILRARNFVVDQQNDLGVKGTNDSPYDGGIGYGSKGDHSDMSNTFMALEALYYSEYLVKQKEDGSAKLGMKDLNWSAALAFIQRCQNLPSHNKEPRASDDPQNKGGFIYNPGQSMAGEVKLPSGRTALRSYGSISYAGLLSYIYAHLQRDDPRVAAVYEWLQKNYALEENPGMGQQGLFYYYLTMAKALSIYGAQRLELSDGKSVVWREDLTKRLLNLQDAKGFWGNSNNRWWEKDPVLVTAFTIIALDYIVRGM
jgi:squalene-hopene/tetraprenyl-beta-curcumene cyclase